MRNLIRRLAVTAAVTALACGGAAALAAPQAGASTVIYSTGFESGGTGAFSDWYGEAVSNSTTQAYGGSHSLKVDTTSAGAYGQWGIATACCGTWSVSGYSSIEITDEVYSDVQGTYTMYVSWYDGSGNWLSHAQLGGGANGINWQLEDTGTITVPSGAASMQIVIESQNGANVQHWYWDDFVVTGS